MLHAQVGGGDSNCTFHPRINKRSEAIAVSKHVRDEHGGSELERIAFGVDEGGDQLGVIDEDADGGGVTKNDNALQTLPPQPLSKWEELYSARDRRQLSITKISSFLVSSDMNECTFVPNIGVNAYRSAPDSSTAEFVARLHGEHEVCLKKKEEVRNTVEETWFKPEIGRAPLGARNVDNLPIHLHLYNETKKSLVRKKKKVTDIKKEDDQKAAFRALPESARLLHNVKRRACEELFRVLLGEQGDEGESDDKDDTASVADTARKNKVEGEGEAANSGDDEDAKQAKARTESAAWRSALLSTNTCDVSILPSSVATMISPILHRHKQDDIGLDYFCGLMMVELDRVGVEALSGDLRGCSIGTNRNSTKGGGTGASAVVSTFHPSINSKSKKIVKQGGRNQNVEPLFARLFRSQELWESRNKVKQGEREKEVMGECTFRPKLVTSKYRSRYREYHYE